MSCKIKYEEGFATVLGHVFTKPETMWTKADQELVVPTNYSLCVGFSFQTGTLLLLQCFWNYLANSVAKASFMSSREFLFYIVWTFISIIMFPVLQYNFSRDIYDPTYKEIMPELVYGIELFIVACLGVVSHFRFHRLLNRSRDSNYSRSITHKIRYFQELNLILTVVLFVTSSSFVILSADGLTGRKTLNAHKFSADFMICNINTSNVIVWFLVILIFHPKPQSGPGNQGMINPTNEFLSGPTKPPTSDGGYGSSPAMMTEASQASSDYLQYSKSGTGTTNGAIDSAYAASNGYHLGPLPPPPDSMYHNNSVASSTPSTATLVSSPNRHTGSTRTKGAFAMDPTESMIDDTTHLPPYRPVNNLTQQRMHPMISQPMESVLTENVGGCQQCQQCQQQLQSPHPQPHHTAIHTNTITEEHLHTVVNVMEGDALQPTPESAALAQRDLTINSLTMSRISEDRRHLDDSDNESGLSSSNRQHPNWQLSLDFSDKGNPANSNVKRENSDDSMWLHQSPKGVGHPA
ncbi:hypothetical protein DM01DRAFT_1317601 [Hesseltinella vesiculosa]|uniref:Uncharacterized protein n=1 Tax=Hesseltinella vesiculosa TaxID=101127 RepID=A0A1X2GSE7_9FUNG|nr:hypothetical protein DM01DRAFT_1317601 [Hesseltinella vesiculosa]